MSTGSRRSGRTSSRRSQAGRAPQQLYAEPDLTVRIVRDLFTEDFSELIISGNGRMTDAYDAVEAYVAHVAPHLKDRLRRWDDGDQDLFAEYRLDEQIAKGLERKVFLPSGGSLVIDRTEAMTVIDVNTGKFTGTGGNLEATVTKQQPGGRRGDRPPAAAARHRRHHRDRLHRHGAAQQPRAAAAPAGRVPGPRPDPAPGRRGHQRSAWCR